MSSSAAHFLACAIALPTAAADEAGSDALREAIQRYRANLQMGDRVINGKPTTIERNPWQVALLHAADNNNERAQFCGGVIIEPEWILTAAHCVDKGTRATQIHVFSGSSMLKDEHGKRTETERIFVHPSWNPKTHDSDVALIKTTSANVGRPIAIANDMAGPGTGAPVWISGWGLVDKVHIKPTPVLHGAEVNVVDWTICNSGHSYPNALTPNMFCAGIVDTKGGGGTDSCKGDSGGPASLGQVSDGRLVGLVSWGKDCAQPYKYGVYVNIARYLPWIRICMRASEPKEYAACQQTPARTVAR